MRGVIVLNKLVDEWSIPRAPSANSALISEPKSNAWVYV
jgi:hypothetical protein